MYLTREKCGYKIKFYVISDDIMNKIKEAGFNIAARKETELTKEIAEQFYKAQEGSEYFEDLTQHMSR